MTIDLQNSKKKHPNFVCLSVSAASKFVSGEYTCKSGLKANYFYKSGKVFNNPRWNLEHGLALQESIKFLKTNYKDIFLYDRESIKIKMKIGNCWIFGVPDQVARVGNKLIVLDAKSGESKFFHRFQLSLYSLMISRKLGLDVSEMYLSYYNPRNSNDKFNVISLGGHEEINKIWSNEHKKELVELTNLILSDEPIVPTSNQSNCQYCDWRAKCTSKFEENEEVLNLFADVKL